MSMSEGEVRKIVEYVLQHTLGLAAPTGQSTVSHPQQDQPDQERRTVAIGADHGGYSLKESLKSLMTQRGYDVVDCGTDSAEPVDYPDTAYAVAQLVSSGQVREGILIDGAGIGSCIAANKVPGVRASMCYNQVTAVNSREHNHANVLTLGSGLIDHNLARQIMMLWLQTSYGEDRHARRVEKIAAIERRFQKTNHAS